MIETYSYLLKQSEAKNIKGVHRGLTFHDAVQTAIVQGGHVSMVFSELLHINLLHDLICTQALFCLEFRLIPLSRHGVEVGIYLFLFYFLYGLLCFSFRRWVFLSWAQNFLLRRGSPVIFFLDGLDSGLLNDGQTGPLDGLAFLVDLKFLDEAAVSVLYHVLVAA